MQTRAEGREFTGGGHPKMHATKWLLFLEVDMSDFRYPSRRLTLSDQNIRFFKIY